MSPVPASREVQRPDLGPGSAARLEDLWALPGRQLYDSLDRRQHAALHVQLGSGGALVLGFEATKLSADGGLTMAVYTAEPGPIP